MQNGFSLTSAARKSTDSPTHAPTRYVINFGDMTEEEARRWPDLIAIVEEKSETARMQRKQR